MIKIGLSMGESIRRDTKVDVEVAVATLDGKAYYKVTALLKSIDIPFINLAPSDKIRMNIRLVLTTREEAKLVDHDKIVFIEDLSDDPGVAKEEIFRHLYGGGEDTLVIGIDPGERIGMVAYYQQRQVDGWVMSSVDGAVERVAQLIRNTPQARRTVRIGDGAPELAEKIAKSLVKRFRRSITVELVDERGTSSLSRTSPNKRVIRDQRSAMMIAFRQGRRYSA